MNPAETLAHLREQLDLMMQSQNLIQNHWEQTRPLLDANGAHFQAITTHIDKLRTTQRALSQMVGILLDLLEYQEALRK